MDLSIIVPVANDVRIKQCIESVDEDVEVVVALNAPTVEIRDIVSKLGVRTCELGERNLGAALDEGIVHSTKDSVLMMDSDCTFEKGTVRKLYEGLADYKLAKGRIVYRTDGRMSEWIAAFREFVVEGPNAFKPPLAFRKSIIDDIGYYYDRDICWVEDAEFHNRVRARGLPINYVPDGIIYHPILAPRIDLRSAFMYGTGKRRGVEKGIMKGVGTFFPQLFSIARSKGLPVATYSVLWNLVYTGGFYAQALKGAYGRRSSRYMS